jgi:MFS family permease
VNLIRVVPAEEIEMSTLSINKYQHLNSTHRSIRSYRWSLIIGNLLEHFDSSLYGFLAPLIGKAFFPGFSLLYQLILAYSVYLITFLARPLGGLFFSKLTYHYSLLKVLSWSLIGVAMATGMMGLIPGAAQIGIMAPCLLVSVRFMQSFCAAGENAIAGYYLIEKCSKEQKMPWIGIYESSTVLGILAASSLSSLILLSSDDQELWRYAFLLGFVLGLWALWMRLRYQEEDTVRALPHERVFSRLKVNWRLVLCLIPIYGFSYLTYSIPFVFLNPFVAQTTSLSLPILMQQTTSLLWLDALMLPGVAWVVKHLSWHKTLLGSAVIFALGACILFIRLPDISLLTLFLLRLVMVSAGVGFTAALIPWTASLYPPRDKYVLRSVSYSIGSELFGRSTPAICLWLYALINHPTSPLFYIVGLTIVTFGLILWLQLSYRVNTIPPSLLKTVP